METTAFCRSGSVLIPNVLSAEQILSFTEDIFAAAVVFPAAAVVFPAAAVVFAAAAVVAAAAFVAAAEAAFAAVVAVPDDPPQALNMPQSIAAESSIAIDDLFFISEPPFFLLILFIL